jgi:hypothetical protein
MCCFHATSGVPMRLRDNPQIIWFTSCLITDGASADEQPADNHGQCRSRASLYCLDP